MATDPVFRFIKNPIDYDKMLEVQEKERADVLAGHSSGAIFFLEHTPVYTSGLRGTSDHFLSNTDTPVFKIKRGGEVTWHGPGQLVIYPVIHMKKNGFSSVREFVSYFGSLIAETLQDELKLKDSRWIDEKAGVWLQDKKIAFSGLHFRKFVPIHGFSINISCKLDDFHKIIPCGIEGLKVTSVELENGVGTKVFEIAEKIVFRLKQRFVESKIKWEAL